MTVKKIILALALLASATRLLWRTHLAALTFNVTAADHHPLDAHPSVTK
jgi:hypothetical protein